ncbi:MAG: 30S ribosomal protein S6 [Candidatus Obscuribacterales bacterium]|nr:30S ribosomal protein S6 [Candidatus Obscuribacterales bacterium]
MSETKLRKYETVYIIRPTLDDESVDRTVNTVEEFIKAQGGNIITSEKKGRRRLSYEVKKMRDGFFVAVRYEVKSEAITPLKRLLSLSEDIIRSITVKVDELALQVSL